jgi:sigma-B regulation protein RsbU (phosphoserine phosphatase)
MTMVSIRESENERRRAERLLLTPPVPGRVAGREVAIHEIGLLGGRVEHEGPWVASPTGELVFQWHGEEVVIGCKVAHSEKLHLSNGRYSTGLSFDEEPDASDSLRRVVGFLAAREEIERLKTVVEASKLINSSIEADSLYNSILSVARNELGVERGTLYFVDKERGEIWAKIANELETGEIRLPIGKGIAGSVAATGEPVILYDAYSDPRFDRSQDQRSGFRTRSMLCVAIRNRDGVVVGVLQLLNKRHGSFGTRDLEFLDAISDHMAIAMENATLHMSLIEKDRMEQELNLGREIQSRLLPRPPVDIHSTELAAISVPCFEVGGDYYDFIEFSDGDLGLAIADVSGKGVASALIMSSVQAALRMSAPIEPNLSSLMKRLNALIFRMAGGRKYVTFFFGRYRPSTGELRYVNAGHNPPFVITDNDVLKIDSTGRPVGILPDATFEEGFVTIPPGSTLFLYTDGLNEAENPKEEEYGMQRLADLVTRAAREQTDRVAPMVLEHIHAYEEGTHATDDKTVVVMRRSWGTLVSP